MQEGSTWAHRREKNGRSGGRLSKFAEGQIRHTPIGSRGTFSFARDGCGPHREHAIQHLAPEEGRWGTSVEERHATKRRESVSSAL